VTRALRVGACFVVLLAAAAPASADWHFTPFAGISFKGSTTIVDFDDAAGRVHGNYGIAVNRVGAGPLAIEGLVTYVPGFLDRSDVHIVTSARTFAVMGNVVVATPRKWNEYGLRPFVSGGVGLLHASSRDFLRVFSIRRNVLGYDIGGGAVGFVSNSTGYRFDVRYFSNLRPTDASGESVFSREHLSFWTASVGFVIRLRP
jgi:hypothetical protein